MKILGYIIGGLLLIYLALCFMGPKEIQASRSTVIDAPASMIYKHVGDLKNWKEWMPWYQNDPEMKLSFGEQTAGVGGHYSWESKNSGNGKMKITEADPGKSMQTEIDFGDMGTSRGSWAFEPTDDGKTKVTWGMQADDPVPFPMRGMLVAMGMQKQMDSDFDQGLASLKELAETAMANLPTAYDGYEVKQIDFPATTFIAERKEVTFAEMNDFFQTKMSLAGATAGDKMKGHPCGLYYEWDPENQKTDMAVAVPVSEVPESLPEGMAKVEMQGAKAVQIDYYGSYDGSAKAHEAMDKYFSDRGWKILSPVMEEYVTDPTTVDDPSKILTKVTYMYTET